VYSILGKDAYRTVSGTGKFEMVVKSTINKTGRYFGNTKYFAESMLYGSECWTVDNKIEHRMSVTEMRMLRWINGVTRDNRAEHW